MSSPPSGASPEETAPEHNAYFASAQRLHRYLVERHWDGSAVVGPDPGIRFNARIGRFIKSSLPFVPWKDNMAYMQAQGYWLLANAALLDWTGDERHRSFITAGAEFIRDRQVDGHWLYPNPEWRSRVATVEGCFAALGLLTAHEVARVEGALAAATAWYDYIESTLGFRDQGGDTELAVNYFSHDTGRIGGVPNNSTLLLWLMARLWQVTGDARYLVRAEPLTRWLARTQLTNGELPYALGERPGEDTPHFLCHQYNAFEFLDLVHYRRLTGDESVTPILGPLAAFLASGLDYMGRPFYACDSPTPWVLYYGVAIARALSEASRLGLGDYRAEAALGFAWVLDQQMSDGSFRFHSSRNYGFLRDVRSYPRYLSMILLHLIEESRPRGEL